MQKKYSDPLFKIKNWGAGSCHDPPAWLPKSHTGTFVTVLRQHKGFSQAGHLSSTPGLQIAIPGALQSLTTPGLVCI